MTKSDQDSTRVNRVKETSPASSGGPIYRRLIGDGGGLLFNAKVITVGALLIAAGCYGYLTGLPVDTPPEYVSVYVLYGLTLGVGLSGLALLAVRNLKND